MAQSCKPEKSCFLDVSTPFDAVWHNVELVEIRQFIKAESFSCIVFFLSYLTVFGPNQHISSAWKSHGSRDVGNELRSSRLFVDDLTVAPSVINQALAVC